MSRFFIRLFLVGPDHLLRLPVQPFFVLIVQAKKPRGVADGPGTDHVIQMILEPAFLTPLLPFSSGVYSSLVDPYESGIRQGGEAALAGCLFDPPLQPKELSIVTQLGIEQW